MRASQRMHWLRSQFAAGRGRGPFRRPVPGSGRRGTTIAKRWVVPWYYRAGTKHRLPHRESRSSVRRRSQSIAVHIHVEPSRSELQHLLDLVESHRGTLTDVEHDDIVRCLGHGAFAGAIDILDAARREDPHNITLLHFRDALRKASIHLLEHRLENMHRFVQTDEALALGVVGSSYTELIALARDRKTLLELVHAAGGDMLRTLERIVRLVRNGALVLGSPRPTDHL